MFKMLSARGHAPMLTNDLRYKVIQCNPNTVTHPCRATHYCPKTIQDFSFVSLFCEFMNICDTHTVHLLQRFSNDLVVLEDFGIK